MADWTTGQAWFLMFPDWEHQKPILTPILPRGKIELIREHAGIGQARMDESGDIGKPAEIVYLVVRTPITGEVIGQVSRGRSNG